MASSPTNPGSGMLGASRRLDPTADAAALLRRIGFATLALALPAASLVSRRAGVVLAPIGVGLLLAAAIIEGPERPLRELRDIVFSKAGALLMGLAGWIVLAASWSPFRGSATEKAINLGFAILLGVLGSAALPSRMRAANLNLIPLGVALASALAIGLAITELRSAAPVPDADGSSLARGLALASVIVWPALAWLLSRRHMVAAIVMAAIVVAVALARFGHGGATAVVVGATAFGLVSARPQFGGRIVAGVCAGLMAFAPLLPFLLKPFVAVMPERWILRATIARDIVVGEPVKLVTGHGLDSLLRSKLNGILPAEAPNSLLFETWYELGLVGALTAALCLWFAIQVAARMPGALAAGGVAAYATAFALSAMGAASLQSWWLVTLAAVVILFTAIARGQVRTERPLAPAWFGRKAPPPEG